MASKGGAGRMGLWLVAFRNPLGRTPQGGFDLDAGCMLSYTPKVAWLFSFGIKGVGTLGFGWVRKVTREHDAAHQHGIEHQH